MVREGAAIHACMQWAVICITAASQAVAPHPPDSSGASGMALAMPLPMLTISPLPRAFMRGSTILQSWVQGRQEEDGRYVECKHLDLQLASAPHNE